MRIPTLLSVAIQFALVAILWTGSVPSQAAESNTSVPGIVAEHPADGPCVAVESGYMVPYTETIPGSEVTFQMVPIPGGEFLLGSPSDEQHRSADEGPQVRVRVAPFWIGRCEVTWAEYQAFMAMYDVFKKLQRLRAAGGSDDRSHEHRLVDAHAWNGKLADAWGVDAVTSATPLYDASFTYGPGELPNQPAVTMTQYAAKQYTKWLSGITGRHFRLPTEAEWEYAARAGTTSAYSFGDDPAELEQYAWFRDNANYQTHPVGGKRPNAWGLFDMHGNVAEWVLDQYDADAYRALGKEPIDASQAVRWPTKLFPRAIRGGSWLDPAANCRSASRQKSEEDQWKLSDPNIPLSPWWYTEEPATGVGMRIVRPLEPMSAAQQARVWETDVEVLRQDVADRLQEGRGALGITDPLLPAAAQAAEKLDQDSSN